jgi:hypothetical protein
MVEPLGGTMPISSASLEDRRQLETFLVIIRRLGLAPDKQIENLLGQTEQVGRMLTALRTRLSSPAVPNP